MINKKKLDIIIPVYNEGELIVNTLRTIENFFQYPFNVFICYDYDTDNTLDAIEKSSLDKKNIFYIKNKFKGAHGAVMSGIHESISDTILVIPADDDYNTINIQRMFDFMTNNQIDVLCPDRFIEKNSIINGPFVKFLIVRIVNFSLYYLANVYTKDATNGFRFFSRRVIDNIKIQSNTGFIYSLEYLVKSIEKKYKIGRFPAKWIERKKGQSRFTILKWSLDYLYWYFYAFKIKLYKNEKK
jgi:dolichol-phosphate mannosyltransferase